MSCQAHAALVPGLALGFERRTRLGRVKGLSLRRIGSVHLEFLWVYLARRYGAEEAVEIMAEGGWRGWAARRRRLDGTT